MQSLKPGCKRFLCPVFLILGLVLCLRLPLSARDEASEKSTLPEKYRQWLQLTSYIMLPQEKDVFLQLHTDRERDIFMQAFWKQRDPTPGTAQNEYLDEIRRRYAYANTELKRGTPREGWRSDMGRIYMVLGEPHSIERFDFEAGIHPCQVWYYYGDRTKGLPTYFALLFFQRNGSGEYKLYNPTSDGPTSLMVNSGGLSFDDYLGAYRKIKELAPTLAGASLSMIPGELPMNFVPSPRTNIILADIYESPTKEVSPSYATHFLEYKGIVSTEYLTNYVESVTDTALIHDALTGLDFLHFSLSPQSLSLDYYEPKDQYYCSFQLNVSLHQGDTLVYQYSRDFPFYFAPDDLEKIEGRGISIQDSFPVIEGEYRLNLLVQNSVGKEFSVFEKDISVSKSTGPAKIIGPVLGFELKEYPSQLRVPFKLIDKKLEVDPNNTFASKESIVVFFNLNRLTEPLWEQGRIKVEINGLRETEPVRRVFELSLKDYPFKKTLGITHSVPAGDFSPDYYEIRLTLLNGNQRMVDKAASRFIISPQEIVPHPVTLAKSFPPSHDYLYFYSLAYQYDKVKKTEKALSAYEKAVQLNPDFKEGLVEYAHFLVREDRLERALELVEGLQTEEKYRFEYYLIRGMALMKSGDMEGAISHFQAGNRLYDSDIRLLNNLGFCYLKTGREKQALEVLKASLTLSPEQKSVKTIVKDMVKKN